MKTRILNNKMWVGVLAILVIFAFGLTNQADARSRGNQSVEAVAKASAYVGTAPLQVQFNAGSSIAGAGSIKTCEWSFGRKQSDEGVIVNHTFDDPGRYVVRLTVENTLGDSDRDRIIITVKRRQIHVDDMSISLVPQVSGALKAQATTIITDDNGTPVPDVMIIGQWKGLVRGNATAITDADGKAVFVSESSDKDGIFRFKVRYAGVAGCQFVQGKNDIRISTDEYTNLPPEVNLTCDRLCGPAPFNVSFCGKSCFDPDGEIVDFQWDFGDGSELNEMGGKHEYKEAGTYHATLTITDNGGKKAEGEIIIFVTGAPE